MLSKGPKAGFWVLKGALALLMIFTGINTLLQPGALAAFSKWGYPEYLVYVIGILEFIGGIGLMIRIIAAYAGAVVVVILVGAMVTLWRDGASVALVVFYFGLISLYLFIVYYHRPVFLRSNRTSIVNR